MRGLFTRFRERWSTPLGIICVVVFIVLPIVLAMPLLIWLTRQMDRLPIWWNAPSEPSTPWTLESAERRTGHEQIRLGRQILQEPVLPMPSAAGPIIAQMSRNVITHTFAETTVGGELATVDRHQIRN
jgi:hypothetical protein